MTGSLGVPAPLRTETHSHTQDMESLPPQDIEAPPPQEMEAPPSQEMRWGRLFGARSRPTANQKIVSVVDQKTQRTRLPSGWLGLDRSVLGLVVQTVGVGLVKGVELATTTIPLAATSTTESTLPSEDSVSPSGEPDLP